MFGPLGVPEILFILVLALLIFGPRRLPDVGRTLGKAMGEFRRASTELKRSINTEIALEDEDEKPRYTRSARPERSAGEGDEPGRAGGAAGGTTAVAGEETVRPDEAAPRREDREDLDQNMDLGRWTRGDGVGEKSGVGEENGAGETSGTAETSGTGERSGDGEKSGEASGEPAAQPGTVPRTAAGRSRGTSGREDPADDRDPEA